MVVRVTPSMPAICGGSQALVGALHDQVPGELVDGAEELEDEHAVRRGGVEILLEHLEPDTGDLQAAAGTIESDRGTLIKEFTSQYLRRPGAKLPERLPAASWASRRSGEQRDDAMCSEHNQGT